MVHEAPDEGNGPLAQSVAVATGRARATSVPSIAAALQELLAHDVAAWDTFGLERFKERTVRSVFRGVLAGVPVHVKVFRADTLADRARDALRRPRGATEAKNLVRARENGIPVVEPLAYGIAVDGDHRRAFVVTHTVEHAAPFDFTMDAPSLRRAGALLRRIQDAGIDAGDLHPGNLLVDRAGDLHALDLTSVRFGGPPTLARRAARLAFFCQELDGGAVDPRARELLDAYLAAGAALPASFRRELELATHRWRASALVAFGRRATRTCRHTRADERRRGRPRWFVHLPAGDADALTAECERLLADGAPPLRRGRRGAVWLHSGFAVKERDAGAARRLWLAAYWLVFARVPSAPLVALRLTHDRGFVFCRDLGAPSLATEIAAGALDAGAVTASARSIGNGVGRLHAHGLRNRDLKFENLVRDPVTREVCIVDLDGVRRASTTDTRGRGADLGRLLAAFRGAGSPGGDATVRTFVRAYLRAHGDLLQTTPLRRVARRAEQRAGEWASAHR
ncbi:MAG: hypothetical protein JNK78_17620 [Planctomycetes bacterium]|nr:hypothetical protein [Planctomycetota bacterium]